MQNNLADGYNNDYHYSFDLCERLRAQGMTTPILFLTACDEEYQIVRGLDAGGDDYVTLKAV